MMVNMIANCPDFKSDKSICSIKCFKHVFGGQILTIDDISQFSCENKIGEL